MSDHFKSVNELSNFLRETGYRDVGAGELAERICTWLDEQMGVNNDEIADSLAQERDRLIESERQARHDERCAMSYLNEVREIVGGADFPEMVRRVRQAKEAHPPTKAYPLPGTLYPGSKDWVQGSYCDRVEWLHRMYQSAKEQLEALLDPASAQPSSSAERSANDYAIEHAGYLVTSAEHAIAQIHAMALTKQQLEEGEASDDDYQAAEATLGDHLRDLACRIHDFRKRRDRALADKQAGSGHGPAETTL